MSEGYSLKNGRLVPKNRDLCSVARLQQGYGAELGKEHSYLVAPGGTRMGVARHGSLLFLRHTVVGFNKQVFEEGVEHFSRPVLWKGSSKPLGCPNFSTCPLPREHFTRKTLFAPEGTKDRPVAVTDLAGERVTRLQNLLTIGRRLKTRMPNLTSLLSERLCSNLRLGQVE